MRSQPNRNYVSNDVVQTPVDLARRIVEHFRPWGKILEPCAGDGNFLKVLPPGTLSCEITRGSDFFAWDEKVNWIITNPPWSKIRRFLAHSMTVADHIVFLMTINHCWTKARIRDVLRAGFYINEIALVEMPEGFPQSGFQLGAVHFTRRSYEGFINFTDLSVPKIITHDHERPTG